VRCRASGCSVRDHGSAASRGCCRPRQTNQQAPETRRARWEGKRQVAWGGALRGTENRWEANKASLPPDISPVQGRAELPLLFQIIGRANLLLSLLCSLFACCDSSTPTCSSVATSPNRVNADAART